jgi:hypothetical protein
MVARKTRTHRIVTAALSLTLSTAATAAVTNVVTNGSFENGLSGWTTDQVGSTITACGFNVAAPAPGTESITGTAGFPATAGTANVVGALQQSAHQEASCVIYRDVAIPAGATTATFRADIGVKLLNGLNTGNAGIFYGIYPTTSVPQFNSAKTVVLGGGFYSSTADTNLVTQTAASLNVSSIAGKTVRLAFIIASISANGEIVGGLDNISLNVTHPDPVEAPTLSEWSKLTMIALLLGVGGVAVARRRA